MDKVPEHNAGELPRFPAITLSSALPAKQYHEPKWRARVAPAAIRQGPGTRNLKA
jgi:hypothetical protein